ncbi:hypothetical protein [Candidatus Binatus sp.]|uniref:hypothetical protein n=1 Tax=Candidatus Binatus sp. TaxID=2811406 RepID=UPI003CC5B601
MNRKWSRIVLPLLFLFAALMVSHLAFADDDHGHRRGNRDPFFGPVSAPEIDPRLAIEGLAIAGGAAVLIWERVRRRR